MFKVRLTSPGRIFSDRKSLLRSPVLEPVNDEGSPGHFGMSPHSERKGTKGYAASDSSVSTVWQPQAVAWWSRKNRFRTRGKDGAGKRDTIVGI